MTERPNPRERLSGLRAAREKSLENAASLTEHANVTLAEREGELVRQVLWEEGLLAGTWSYRALLGKRLELRYQWATHHEEAKPLMEVLKPKSIFNMWYLLPDNKDVWLRISDLAFYILTPPEHMSVLAELYDITFDLDAAKGEVVSMIDDLNRFLSALKDAGLDKFEVECRIRESP